MLNDNYSHFDIMVPLGFNPFGNGQAPLTSIGACLPPGGGSLKFYRGRLRPEVLKIPFLTKQVLLSWVFHIPSIDNGARFPYLV